MGAGEYKYNPKLPTRKFDNAGLLVAITNGYTSASTLLASKFDDIATASNDEQFGYKELVK